MEKTINFGGKLSFILSFLLPECPTHISTSPTRTITKISLEPCALKHWVSAFHIEILKKTP
jgi:hypothetical protein